MTREEAISRLGVLYSAGAFSMDRARRAGDSKRAEEAEGQMQAILMAVDALKGICNIENNPSESTTTIGWSTMPSEEKKLLEGRLEALAVTVKYLRQDLERYTQKVNDYLDAIEEMVR